MIDRFEYIKVYETIILLTMLSLFIRYFISFFLPEEVRNYLDNQFLIFRNSLIDGLERVFTKKNNFEILIFTRVIAPFLTIYTIYNYANYYIHQFIFGRFILLTILMYLLQVYLFLNIAPNLNDLERLFYTSSGSRIIFVIKIILIAMNVNQLQNYQVALIIILPFSYFLDTDYQEVMIEDEPSLWGGMY